MKLKPMGWSVISLVFPTESILYLGHSIFLFDGGKDDKVNKEISLFKISFPFF